MKIYSLKKKLSVNSAVMSKYTVYLQFSWKKILNSKNSGKQTHHSSAIFLFNASIGQSDSTRIAQSDSAWIAQSDTRALKKEKLRFYLRLSGI